MSSTTNTPESRRAVPLNEASAPQTSQINSSIASSSARTIHTASSFSSQPNSTSSPAASRALGAGGTLTVESALTQAKGSHEDALAQVVSERNQFHTQNALLWKHVEKVKDTAAGFKKDLDRIRAERDRALDRLSSLTGEDRRPRLASQRAPSLDSASITLPDRNTLPLRGLPETATESTPSLASIEETPSSTPPSLSSRPPIPSDPQPPDLEKRPRPPRSDLRPAVSTSVIPPTPTKKLQSGVQPTPATPGSRSVSQPSPVTPVRANSASRDDVNTSPEDPRRRSKKDPSPARSTASSASASGSSHNYAANISTEATQEPSAASISSGSSALPSNFMSTRTLKAESDSLIPPPVSRRTSDRSSSVTIPDEASRYITSMVDSPVGSPALGANPFGTSVRFPGASTSAPHSPLRTLREDDGPIRTAFPLPPTSESPRPELFEVTRSESLDIAGDDVQSEDPTGDEGRDGKRGLNEDTTGHFEKAASSIVPAAVDMAASRPVPLDSGQRDRAYDQSKPRQHPQIEAVTFSNTLPRSSTDTVDSSVRGSSVHSYLNSAPPTIIQPTSLSYNAPTGPPNQSQLHPQNQNQLSNGPSPAFALQHTPSPFQPQSGAQPSSGPGIPPSDTPRIEYKSAKLTADDLAPNTNGVVNVTIRVEGSTIRPNDRGKEVLSFIIRVNVKGKEGWKIEKLYSDVLSLDTRVRALAGKSLGKKLSPLPDSKLFKDNAPAKVDLRKVALEGYLQSMVQAPFKRKDDICMFFSTGIIRAERAPVHQLGHKEGYLTKRSKNFGGFMKWKTRYFVLQGFQLDYYESRGGQLLGTIGIQNAQIGRQQKPMNNVEEDENAFRHAFLIIELRKPPATAPARHVLCAESDLERDSWVDALVRRVADAGYQDEPLEPGPPPHITNPSVNGATGNSSQTSSFTSASAEISTQPGRKAITKELIGRPISSLPPPAVNSSHDPSAEGQTPTGAITATPLDSGHVARSIMAHHYGSSDHMPLSSSLPDTLGPLSNSSGAAILGFPRASSEMGHYSDTMSSNYGEDARYPAGETRTSTSSTPGTLRVPQRNSYHPSLAPFRSGPTGGISSADMSPVSENTTRKNISGPLNGTPIPPGYNFGGGKDTQQAELASTNERERDRDRKTKSSHFWPFGSGAGDSKSGSHAKNGSGTVMPRAVFGVPITEALQVSQIANLPSVVFRCILYLETKHAEWEEGIYRLSGSSAVIKALKDRFNTGGDIDLLSGEEYWDPHAIAGLLKSYFRDLPSTILTHERHFRFLKVIDLTDLDERTTELASLVASLPFPNYCLLRALCAHLIRIVQNSQQNKMTVRNVGIVFSPTLGIPAGVFSLMLSEYPRVFGIDEAGDQGDNTGDDGNRLTARVESVSEQEAFSRTRRSRRNSGPDTARPDNRNSVSYNEGSVDRLLGLQGRILATPEEGDSDVDMLAGDESDGETDGSLSVGASEDEAAESGSAAERTNSSSPTEASTRKRAHRQSSTERMVLPSNSEGKLTRNKSHGAAVAATRGLQIRTEPRPWTNTATGLPVSPRPGRNHQQSQGQSFENAPSTS